MNKIIYFAIAVLYGFSIFLPVVLAAGYLVEVPLIFKLGALVVGAMLGKLIAHLGTRNSNHPLLLLLFFSGTALLLSKLQLNNLGIAAINRNPDYAAFILAWIIAGLGILSAFRVSNLKLKPGIVLLLLVQANIYLAVAHGF